MASHLREHDQGRSPGSSFEPAWQATAHTIWPVTVILVTGMSASEYWGQHMTSVCMCPSTSLSSDTRYPGSRSASDPLTTVYSPARQIGVTAVDRLLDLINGGEAGSTRLPVELVVRETT